MVLCLYYIYDIYLLVLVDIYMIYDISVKWYFINNTYMTYYQLILSRVNNGSILFEWSAFSISWHGKSLYCVYRIFHWCKLICHRFPFNMATLIDIIRRMTAKIRNIRRLSNSLFGKQYLLSLNIRHTNTFRIKIHIEEIHMAVLGITQYELVSSSEFPCTAHYIACITGDGGKSSCQLRVFRSAFSKRY